MMLRTLVATGIAAAAVNAEEHWAVLVAGSNDYSNYRHQADVCHAYHVLLSRGFKTDNIITMMYDDVARSSENPFPGKLYNYPWKTAEEAVDVYDGCKIDYKGKDVNPKKFTAVLTGDAAAAGGKVLKSKADDHVFVNFVDHGAVGLIAFPGEEPVMHAKALRAALQKMHSKGMYKQLTFYLETCESGSMFQGVLPKPLPVYAVTAANARESSWGTYCQPHSKVMGKDIGSCLGDLFSVNWMQDSDKTKGTNETLKQQFLRVQKQTKKSHVMHFGQMHHIGTEPVSDFQGPQDTTQVKLANEKATLDEDLAHESAVDSRDVRLDYLYHAYRRTGTEEAAAALIAEVELRRRVKALGEELQTEVAKAATTLQNAALDDEIAWTEARLACHERAVEAFGRTCGWKEAHLPLSRTLYTLCARTADDSSTVEGAVTKLCPAAVGDEEIVV